MNVLIQAKKNNKNARPKVEGSNSFKASEIRRPWRKLCIEFLKIYSDDFQTFVAGLSFVDNEGDDGESDSEGEGEIVARGRNFQFTSGLPDSWGSNKPLTPRYERLVEAAKFPYDINTGMARLLLLNRKLRTDGLTAYYDFLTDSVVNFFHRYKKDRPYREEFSAAAMFCIQHIPIGVIRGASARTNMKKDVMACVITDSNVVDMIIEIKKTLQAKLRVDFLVAVAQMASWGYECNTGEISALILPRNEAQVEVFIRMREWDLGGQNVASVYSFYRRAQEIAKKHSVEFVGYSNRGFQEFALVGDLTKVNTSLGIITGDRNDRKNNNKAAQGGAPAANPNALNGLGAAGENVNFQGNRSASENPLGTVPSGPFHGATPHGSRSDRLASEVERKAEPATTLIPNLAQRAGEGGHSGSTNGNQSGGTGALSAAGTTGAMFSNPMMGSGSTSSNSGGCSSSSSSAGSGSRSGNFSSSTILSTLNSTTGLTNIPNRSGNVSRPRMTRRARREAERGRKGDQNEVQSEGDDEYPGPYKGPLLSFEEQEKMEKLEKENLAARNLIELTEQRARHFERQLEKANDLLTKQTTQYEVLAQRMEDLMKREERRSAKEADSPFAQRTIDLEQSQAAATVKVLEDLDRNLAADASKEMERNRNTRMLQEAANAQLLQEQAEARALQLKANLARQAQLLEEQNARAAEQARADRIKAQTAEVEKQRKQEYELRKAEERKSEQAFLESTGQIPVKEATPSRPILQMSTGFASAALSAAPVPVKTANDVVITKPSPYEIDAKKKSEAALVKELKTVLHQEEEAGVGDRTPSKSSFPTSKLPPPLSLEIKEEVIQKKEGSVRGVSKLGENFPMLNAENFITSHFTSATTKQMVFNLSNGAMIPNPRGTFKVTRLQDDEGDEYFQFSTNQM